MRTVIGISGFNIDKKSQEFGFKVEPSLPRNPITTVVFTVNTVSDGNNDRWKYVMFNFIVSDSQDLLLGTKTVL